MEKLLQRIAGRINNISGESRESHVEGGGAAGPWVAVKDNKGREWLFGTDDVFVGNTLDGNHSVETDVVGSSQNADLIARAILDALDAYESLES